MKKGFTLIELLVVVLIIGILAAVALPQYEKAVEKARLAEVVSTMNTLSKALNMHLLANGPVDKYYDETLDSLDITFPNRINIYIAVGKRPNEYRIFSRLLSDDGWRMHVDSDKYGGYIIHWEADGARSCNATGKFRSLCESLKAQGLAK